MLLNNSKHINLILIILSSVIIFSTISVSALSETKELKKSKQAAIVKHCDSIKESLKATQRSDAHARTYLGSIYETVINQFVTPLNVRLLKNNSSDSKLMDIQTNLVDTRSDFNSSFVSYSKSLEELINIDCENYPQDFYSKLEETREERAIVDSYTKKIEQIISNHKQEVSNLEKTL